MVAKRKSRKSDKLQVKRVCGYVAVAAPKRNEGKVHSWLYLRKHSSTQLFIGNIPKLLWSASSEPSDAVKAVSKDASQKLSNLIKLMLPCIEQVGELFSTGNGRLATRAKLGGGEKMIDRVLQKPEDHLYIEYWVEMHAGGKERLMDVWLKQYEDERNERKVMGWSNAAMKAYEAREKRQAEAKERQRVEGGVPDEDGFVMVTSGAKQMKAAEAQEVGTRGKTGKGRYKSKSGKNRKALLDVSKGIEKVGFYRWQRQNQNALADLQRKFREDKKRISAIQVLGRNMEDS